MGRTIPSYRIILEEELKRWKAFSATLLNYSRGALRAQAIVATLLSVSLLLVLSMLPCSAQVLFSVSTDKSSYRVGETVTIYVYYGLYFGGGAHGFYLLISKPDGSASRIDLGDLPRGTTTTSTRAGPALGAVRVDLYGWTTIVVPSPPPPKLELLASCYFQVVGEQTVTLTETVTTTITRTATVTESRTVWRTLTVSPVTVTRTLSGEVTTTVYSPTITVTITKRAQMALNPFLWLALGTIAVLGLTVDPEKNGKVHGFLRIVNTFFPFLGPLSRLSRQQVRRALFGVLLVSLVALSISSTACDVALAQTITVRRTETVTQWITERTTRTYTEATTFTPTVTVTLDRRFTRTIYLPTTVTTTITVNPIVEAAANVGVGTTVGAVVGGIVTTIAGRGLAGAAGLGLAGLTSGLSGAALALATVVPGAVAGAVSAYTYAKTQDAGWSKPASIVASTAVGTAAGTAATVGVMVALGAAVPPIGAAIVASIAVSAAVSLFMSWAMKR